MKVKQLGNSDLDITPIGFGAWAIGGPGWAFAWGPQEDDDSIAAIHEALDLGINWIDTAAVYGLGHSEEVVARARRHGGSRQALRLHQVRLVWDEHRAIGKSLKADSIRRECEASLKRLKVETIDLYQIHWPEPDEDIEEGWSDAGAAPREGKVRWIGVSNFDARQMERARAIAPITSLQPPYSLVNRKIEDEILPRCRPPRDRRPRLLADGLGPALRRHDRANVSPTCRPTTGGGGTRTIRNPS